MNENPSRISSRDVAVSAVTSTASDTGRDAQVKTEVLISPAASANSQELEKGPSELLVDPSTQEDEQVANVAMDHPGSGSDEQVGSTRSGDVSSEEGLEEDFDMEYVYENGRRYANETALFPNDDTEETRLNICHQVRRLFLDGEHTISRIPSTAKRILDIGTGPGDWAIAVGEAFPNAHIIATDITLYSPVAAPPNVDFRIEDATQDWSCPDLFDFIHMRDMVAPVPDFLYIYRQAANHLKRNGTFELVTGGPVMLKYNYENSAMKEWNCLQRAVIEKIGGKIWMDHTGKAAIEQAGLREMKRVRRQIPLGEGMPDSAKQRVGRLALVACLEGIEASSLRALTKVLEWPLLRAQELIERAKAELLDPRNEAYCEVEWISAKRLMI